MALDQLVVRRWIGVLTTAEPRAADLRNAIRRAEHTSRRADAVRAKLRAAARRLRPVDAQQVGFRRHLESAVGPDATLRSSRRVSSGAFGRSEALRKLTYEVVVTGPLEALTAVLWRLDTSEELLRVDHLDLARLAPESPELEMTLTVSTLARSPGAPGLTDGEPVEPSAIDPIVATADARAPRMADIFHPGTAGVPSPGAPHEAFRLAGTIVSKAKRGALIVYDDAVGDDPPRTAWLAPGEWIAGMQVVRITSQAAVFRRDGSEIPLAVGHGSRALLAGEPVLAGSFELLGVQTAPETFALVRIGADAGPRRIAVDDRIGPATVVGIDGEGLTLRLDGRTTTVGIGGAWSQEAPTP
ncbi:MAG: hypothetical protein KGY99_06840 [Phycisphaerae bacterium]|nr:hypothetical protein [Phycisphaerae bacterium]